MTSRILGWAFTILSVVIMWQVRLDSSLQSLARGLGAEAGSVIDKAFVDIGVPLVLSVALVTFNWIYGQMCWRLLSSDNYLSGWWIYSLLADTPEGLKETLGYFKVRHSQDEIGIDQGQAFWPRESLVLRGEWKSQTVWTRGKMIKLVYSMKSERAIEGLPTDYEGYLELGIIKRDPILGKRVWTGSFNDLKHRGLIRGPVYAERLSRLSRHNIESLRDLLVTNKAMLLKRVHEAWPVFSEQEGEAQRPTQGLKRTPAGAA